MQTRVAVMAIIVDKADSVEKLSRSARIRRIHYRANGAAVQGAAC